jgi:hypothetical protein
MSSKLTGEITPEMPVGLRLKIGMVLFVLALIPSGLLAPVIFFRLSLGTIATLTAVGVVLQKVLFVTAVAVLGKPGFAYLKAKLSRRLAPPDEVGPLRYRIGLVLFCLPLIQGLVESYASHIAPDLVHNRLWVDLGGDVMLVASLFVLGGNFWDKLRSLFVRNARAVFP